jgi:GAF domain-containing protein
MNAKTFGALLVAAGTVVGSLGGAHLPQASVGIVAAGLALLGVGAWLLRRTPAGDAAGAGDGSGTASVADGLRALSARLEPLVAELDSRSLEQVCEAVAELHRELIQPLVEAGPGELARLGSARFARVFGALAASERQLARAWSAAADEHRDETAASLARALEHARRAREALE